MKKKEQCFFQKHNIKTIDYRDVDILKLFINQHGRIKSRRSTGVSARSQRQLESAIKRARLMALLPYVSR